MGNDWGLTPDKAARIAAHRAPTWRDKARFGVVMARIIWQTQPRLFAAAVLGVAGAVCLLTAFVVLVAGVMF